MLWFTIIPTLWFFLLREMWNSTGRYDILTWPTDFMGWAETGLGLLLCAVIGGFLAGLAAYFTGSLLNDAHIWHLEDRSTEKLVAVRDKDGVSGGISDGLFLIAGHFKNSPYYFYYTEDKSGTIRPGKVKASRSVFIREIESDQEPKLVERQWDNSRPWLNLIGFTHGGWQYHFYVPKGTVRRDFTM